MNRRAIALITAISALFAGSLCVRNMLTDAPLDQTQNSDASSSVAATVKHPAPAYHRIVSLAPSITEILFALGLGDQVVGVTRYCDYPEAAKTKTQIGGYFDPNNEAIVALNPDLVVLFREHETTRQAMKAAGVPYMEISNQSIADILASIQQIGNKMGPDSAPARRASELVAALKKRMDAVQHAPRAPVQKKKKVMIATGRNMGTGKIEDAYIIGEDGFYQDMIEMVGATNAYQGDVAFPVVSNEGIMRMNPDVIIDMVPDLDEQKISRESILTEWRQFGELSAVKQNQVHLLTDDYVVVPGPRFILLLEQFSRILSSGPGAETGTER